MNHKLKFLMRIIFPIIIVILFCEFFIYYLVISQCSWPILDEANIDNSIEPDRKQPLQAMILADTHILGFNLGHWYDRLRREWQMYRSFQTSLSLLNPEAIFFLGDVLDEGFWAIEPDFMDYVSRFNSLFHHSRHQKVFIMAGNHDVGFHKWTDSYLNYRFQDQFEAPAVKLVTLKGNHFILINSMAMEGDGCFLCQSAIHKITQIAENLNCTTNIGYTCLKGFERYRRPIIMQHFPLFRRSDDDCDIPDDDVSSRNLKYEEKSDCISKNSTDWLLNTLKPRAAFSGHSHHSCHITHEGGILEWTVASFNWRNKRNPSFILAKFSSNNYAVNLCYLPNENTVVCIYLISFILIILWTIHRKKNFSLHFVFKKD